MKSPPTSYDWLRSLAERGGPSPEDYPLFESYLNDQFVARCRGRLTDAELLALRAAFGGSLASRDTLQGLALTKPHGYPGDFEILDKVYRYHLSEEPRFRDWDRYFQQISAAKAVRNRKAYFHRLVESHTFRNRDLTVLEIGAGPGRQYREWFDSRPCSRVRFDAVEIDPNAVEFARSLNSDRAEAIRLVRANPRRFVPDREYDLIWASGLFDYCESHVFVRLLRQLAEGLLPGGELVVGNFSPASTSRAYMEIVGDWYLLYRDEPQLLSLAATALPGWSASVTCEEEGVNFFLHLSRSDRRA